MAVSNRVQEISASQTLKITSLIKKLRQEGKEVINFAAGEPDFDTPDSIKNSALEAIQSGFTKYTPVAGISELREAISHNFKKSNVLYYNADQIIVSDGAKHSIFNALFSILNPGDEVIILAPYWLSYPEMVKLASGRPLFVNFDREDGFRPNFSKIKAKITRATKCLILNTPTNPTGIVWTEKEIMQLSEVVLENNLYLISDEIYEHLVYEGRHISIASISKDISKRTITINGVSKSFAMTGWRIGWMGAPIEIAKEAAKIQSHTTSNPCSISQKAALKALTLGEEWFGYIKNEFKKRRDFLVSELEKFGIPFLKPQGAFYLFMDISSTSLGSFEFAEELLRQKLVGVIPGEPFGNDEFVRLSYATSLEEIKEGVKRIKEFLDGKDNS